MSWNVDVPTATYVDANSPSEDIERLVKSVDDADVVAIDTETTGLNSWLDVPLYWSLAWNDQRATLRADTLPYFDHVLSGKPSRTWVLANAKYDMHILANYGYHLTGHIHDVQVMHSLLYDDLPHNLKYIAKHVLGWTWADFQDSFGKIGAKQSASDVIARAERENFNLLIEYAANDAWGTLKIWEALKQHLEGEYTYSLFIDCPPYINTLWDYFTKVEAPFTPVLWKMERRGIKIDLDYFQEIKPKAEKMLVDLKKQIVKHAGFVMNPNSTAHLRKYCEQAGLQPLGMTKGGKSGVRQMQVNAAFLQHYAAQDEVCRLVLEYRKYEKLYGTYIVGLSEIVDPNARVHSRFNQDTVRTGRLSSSNPNLQTIPGSKKDYWKLRHAFITEPGYKIACADYAQLEMRLLAAAAMAEPMIDIFRRNWDIHSGNASLMYEVPYEDIAAGKKLEDDIDGMSEPELYAAAEELSPSISARCDGDLATYLKVCSGYRSDAKNICFGLNYGMGATKLAKDLKVSREQALEKIRKYKKTYPAVERFMEEAVEQGRKTGYAFTVMGRRRNIPMITSSRKDLRAQGERLAVNTSIQGSAADVTRAAQVLIDSSGLNELYGCHTILQVHDELVFECPEETVKEASEYIEDMMRHPFCKELPCPLDAEAGIGDSWGEAK